MSIAAICLIIAILTAVALVVGVGTAAMIRVITLDTNAKNAGPTAAPTNLATSVVDSLSAGSV